MQPPFDHCMLTAQRLSGVARFQEGVAILRPHYVAFLPTRGTAHLGLALADSLLSPVALSQSTEWSFDAAAGPGAFDQQVIAAATGHGVLFQQGDGTERVGAIEGPGPVVSGHRLTVLQRGPIQVTLRAPPGADLTPYLAHWPETAPRFEGGKLALIFLMISALPGVVSVAALGWAVVHRDWEAALGGLCWGLFALAVWVAYGVIWLRARRAGHLGA
jgi:hypothetical protein